MLLSEFQEVSAGYDFDAPTKGKLWFYALGLCGEAGETTQKVGNGVGIVMRPLLLELGDCLWYLAAIANLAGHKLQLWSAESYHVVDSARGLVIATSQIAEVVKKHYRDGASLDALPAALDTALSQVELIAQGVRSNILEVAHLNVEKLESRRQRGTSRGSGDNR